MVDLYALTQRIADNLLTKFNQPMTLVRYVTAGTGPEHSPGEPTTVRVPLTGAVAKGVSTKYIMRGLALEGDLEITMKASVAPNIKDSILVGAVPYKIVSLQSVPAGGPTVVVYKVIARRS